jgi:hypothetical protein
LVPGIGTTSSPWAKATRGRLGRRDVNVVGDSVDALDQLEVGLQVLGVPAPHGVAEVIIG